MTQVMFLLNTYPIILSDILKLFAIFSIFNVVVVVKISNLSLETFLR